MVCLGNICRSPMAHGILNHKANKANLEIHVDSAGTGNWHIGNQPDFRSISIAKKNGIDITNQKARQISTKDLYEYDLVYAMDKQNYKDIIKLCSQEEQKHKIKLILNETKTNANESVPDPYYDEIDGFEKVFTLLNEACQNIIEKLKEDE